MSYTPGEVWALIELAEARQRHEQRDLLAIHTLAARGDPKEVERKLRELSFPRG